MSSAKPITLEYCQTQVKLWEQEVEILPYSDDFCYTNGRLKRAEENLKYWQTQTNQLKGENNG